MPRFPRIEFIDFKERALKDKRFRGSIGLFLDRENILAIDSHLPEETNGTRRQAIAHEMAHARVRRSGARRLLTPAQEEAYCELESLYTTPNRALSHAEEILKRVLVPGLRWSRRRDRTRIRQHLFHLLGVPHGARLARLLGEHDR